VEKRNDGIFIGFEEKRTAFMAWIKKIEKAVACKSKSPIFAARN